MSDFVFDLVLTGLVVSPVVAMIWRIVRAVQPMRVEPSEPPRFRRPFEKYSISTMTGYATGVRKVSTDYTSTWRDSEGFLTSQDTIVEDQFFVTDAAGAVHAVRIRGFDVPLTDGHLVSVAWATKEGEKSGAYFLAYNHTVRRYCFGNYGIRTLTWPRPNLSVVLVVLNVLYCVTIPLPITLLIAERMQVRRFKREGVAPLVEFLDRQVASLPADGPIKLDDLDRLSQLAREGLLTDEEWTRAKELFLGKAPDRRAASLENLRQLHALHREGALSEGEFNGKKWEILSRESRLA